MTFKSLDKRAVENQSFLNHKRIEIGDSKTVLVVLLLPGCKLKEHVLFFKTII